MTEKSKSTGPVPENSATPGSAHKSQKPKEDTVTTESSKTQEKGKKKETPKKVPPKKDPPKKVSPIPKGAPSRNFVVSLSDIELPDKWNREKPGNLGSLTTSLKTIGQIVALVVSDHPTKKGKYFLRDGRRRYMALQDLKVKEAVVTFTDGDETEMYTKSLVANINREGHNPLEIAHAFFVLTEGGRNNRDIARACGVSEGHVSQHLSLLDLDISVQKAIAKDVISMSQARVLCKVNEEEHSNFFFRLFEQMVSKGLSAQESDDKTKAYLDRFKQRQKEKAEEQEVKDVEGGKTPSKGSGPKKPEKKVGRPETQVPTYDGRVKEIMPASKTTLVAYLNGHSERLSRASSDKTKNFLKGVLHGLELASGLKE